MKKFILIMLMILASHFSYSNDLNTQEIATLNFYKWYTEQIEKNISPAHENKGKELKKFITNDLKNRLSGWIKSNQIEYDYFTKSQDFGENWNKNIQVHVTETLGKESTVLVTLGNKTRNKNDLERKLAVQLKELNGTWKIENVLNINVDY